MAEQRGANSALGPEASLGQLRAALAAGTVTSEQLVEVALKRIREKPTPFVLTFEESARAQARAADAQRACGAWLGPLAGIPVAVKDILDMAGQATAAGRPRAQAVKPRAEKNAAVVDRLLAAGAVIMGKTVTTELACTGLGYNPHYEWVVNPFGPRAAGGSSVGSGVSVSGGQVVAALGSDTGGSIRIPAAFCGITGFKPSLGVVPSDGCHPLCPESLDTIGPLARSVEDCAVVFRVLAGHASPATALESPPMASLRFLVPTPFALEGLEAPVDRAFGLAVAAVRKAGGCVDEVPMPMLGEDLLKAVSTLFCAGAANANADILGDPERAATLETTTKERMMQGSKITAEDNLAAQQKLQEVRRDVELHMHEGAYDAMLMPSVPIVPPLVADLTDEAHRLWATAQCSRFTRLINGLAQCAASLPCHPAAAGGSQEEVLPVGIMVAGEAGGDERCLAVSKTIEAAMREAGLGTARPEAK